MRVFEFNLSNDFFPKANQVLDQMGQRAKTLAASVQERGPDLAFVFERGRGSGHFDEATRLLREEASVRQMVQDLSRALQLIRAHHDAHADNGRSVVNVEKVLGDIPAERRRTVVDTLRPFTSGMAMRP